MRERLWWVVEWSCTEMESGNVFYTPDLPLGSLRDVMGLRPIGQSIATSSGRQSAGLEINMRPVGCAGAALARTNECALPTGDFGLGRPSLPSRIFQLGICPLSSGSGQNRASAQ